MMCPYLKSPSHLSDVRVVCVLGQHVTYLNIHFIIMTRKLTFLKQI